MFRPSLVGAAAVAVALLLSGCAGPTGLPAGTSNSCLQAQGPLASLELTTDPRSWSGPTTACLASAAIEPIDDSTAPALPVALTDAEGRSIEVTDVSRILPIDISGTIAATVFALGLGDRVVGRDASTQFDEAKDLPVVTRAGHTLNPEAILQLAPTIVLTDTSIGPKEVRQQLRDAGITVVVISAERRLDTTDALVVEIATALGVPTRGRALAARVDADVATAKAEIDAAAPVAASDRPRMLFLYVRGSANVYYIFGEDSGADSLIDAVDGVDVASEIGWQGMKPMTAEALVAARPDVLVMMTDGLASVGGVDGLIERIPALARTPAGERRRVIDMADSQILSFGPRSAEIVSAMARALYAPADSPARTSTATPTPGASTP